MMAMPSVAFSISNQGRMARPTLSLRRRSPPRPRDRYYFRFTPRLSRRQMRRDHRMRHYRRGRR
jgi:hypothetical protein